MNRFPHRNRDLMRRVILIDLLRALGFLLWLTAWIGGAIAYNVGHKSYPDQLLIIGGRLVYLIITALVSGFLLFRVWRLFGARFTHGVIERSSLSHSYSASDDPGGKIDYDFRLNTKLCIRKTDGKLKTVSFEQKRGFYHYYYEGAPILVIRGLPYPIRTDSDRSVGYVCTVCGMWHESPVEVCRQCGKSMLDLPKSD